MKFSASNDGIFGYLGVALVSGTKTPVFWDTSQHTIWHAGNFTPNDYLPKSGGTLSGTGDTPLYIKSGVEGGTSSWLGFMNAEGTLIGRFGVDNGTPKFYYNSNYYNIATETWVTNTATAHSASQLSTSRTIWGQSFDGTADIAITTCARMPYVIFKNYDNSNAAGYCGRSASSNNYSTEEWR